MNILEADLGDRWLRDEQRLFLESKVANLERAIISLEKENKRLNSENHLLCCIVMEIVGLPPNLQRDRVGSYYERRAYQDEFPNVRDVVKALLNISKKDYP